MKKKPARQSKERRASLRREADVERRLGDVEDLAKANRRELDLQFRRMADLQAELDKLLRKISH